MASNTTKYFFLLNSLLNLLVLFAILPRISMQQSLPGVCVFSFDSENRYTCELFNAAPSPDGNELHLPGRTDNDVQVVIHRNVTFSMFNGEIFRRFGNLRFVTMRSTNLQRFSETAFENCAQLEELDVSINLIWTLHRRMLRNCDNLRIFNAGSNRITSFPEDFFGITNNLEVFNLQFNSMTLFPDNLLINMRNLRIFTVQGNSITEISPNNIRNSNRMEIINISSNWISNATAVMELLNGHTGLRSIRINGNRFAAFGFEFFAQFQQLEELAIGSGDDSIVNISWQSLPSSIKILSIVGIGEDIPANAFTRMGNMTELYINGRGISQLHSESFLGLTELEILHVTGGSIKTLPPGLFISQTNLRDLSLSNQQIEVLPDGIFAPLVNLGNDFQWLGLNMLSNRIQRLTVNMFGNHPFLRRVIFADNEIYEIQRGVFSRFSNQIGFVDFWRNICTNSSFFNEENLDRHPSLELCFNNFDGITTTTTPDPNGCGISFKKTEIISIIFINFLIILKNLIK